MSQRMYRNTVSGVVEVLQEIFGDGLYADQAIPKLLKQNSKWGSRDRRFVAEHSYNIVRWWKLLWAILEKKPTNNRNDIFQLFGAYWLNLGNELPPWEEFEGLNAEKVLSFNKETLAFAEAESFPDWLDLRATKELGEEWKEIGKSLNLSAPLSFRTNTLKTNRETLQRKLFAENIETDIYTDNEIGLMAKKRINLSNLNLYKSGLFEVQDLGSQEISDFVNPKENDFVIDACAGAGGKTLHLAALMQNKGQIVSMDVEKFKLKELENRTRRNAVKIVKTHLINSDRSIASFHEKADKLLLDVPCSGTGVIKRQPDTKWKLKESDVNEVIELQRHILEEYVKMLKPNGELTYATCSILKSENEDQVNWFLEKFPEYTLIEEKRLNPTLLNDGFYMAKLVIKK